MKSDTRRQMIFFAIVFLVCFLYLLNGVRTLSVGTARSPGPGFLPVIVGSLATLISLHYFVVNVLKLLKVRKIESREVQDISDKSVSVVEQKNDPYRIKAEARKKTILFLAFVITSLIYLFLFTKVNFYILTAIYMFLLGKIFGVKGWLKSVLLGVGFSLFIFLVFYLGFKVHL